MSLFRLGAPCRFTAVYPMMYVVHIFLELISILRFAELRERRLHFVAGIRQWSEHSSMFT